MNTRTAFAGLLLGSLLAGCATSKPEGLLFHCTFDDEASITTPAVGPAGKLEDKVAFVPGKFGNAVQTGPGQRAAVFELPAGTIGERGTIECWAKITDPNITRLRDNGCPNLYSISTGYQLLGHAESFCRWNGNDGCGGHGLCGWIAGARYASNSPESVNSGSVYSSLLGDNPGGWHHYAVSWDSSGLDDKKHQVLVRVDGKIIATAEKVDLRSLRLYSIYSSLLDVPSGNDSSQRVGVAIDDVRIWNKPLASFNIE